MERVATGLSAGGALAAFEGRESLYAKAVEVAELEGLYRALQAAA